MKKRLFSLLMMLTLIVSMFAGCGQASPSAEQAEESGKGLKIAILSSPSGVDDGSFNETSYNGILAFIANHPDCEVTPVKEETGDVAACIQTLSDIVSDYDVFVCDGFQFAAIKSIAEENPEKYFIIVDTYPTDEEGNEVTLDNVYGMSFMREQSGFCAGIAAALETKSNKVAVVNGIGYPTNVDYQYGFMSGVNYANKYYDTNVEIIEISSYAGTDVANNNIGGNYIGGFSDEATGKVVGQALIDQGCDIIFVAAGASGNGVFTAAKESGDVFVIGCDVDQYDDGVNRDKNIILTSATVGIAEGNEMQLTAIYDGVFEGKNESLGIDRDCTGYVSEDGRCQLSKETIEKINEAFEKVKSGEIEPASFASGTLPDNFKGL